MFAKASCVLQKRIEYRHQIILVTWHIPAKTLGAFANFTLQNTKLLISLSLCNPTP